MKNVDYWYSRGDDLSDAKGLQTACAQDSNELFSAIWYMPLEMDRDRAYITFYRLRDIVEACDEKTRGK